MATILEGVRILEVAEHSFVPAASAVLADLTSRGGIQILGQLGLDMDTIIDLKTRGVVA